MERAAAGHIYDFGGESTISPYVYKHVVLCVCRLTCTFFCVALNFGPIAVIGGMRGGGRVRKGDGVGVVWVGVKLLLCVFSLTLPYYFIFLPSL